MKNFIYLLWWLLKVLAFFNFLPGIYLLNNLLSSSSTSAKDFEFLLSFPPLLLIVLIYSDIFFHMMLYFFFHVSTCLCRELIFDLYCFSYLIFWFFSLLICEFSFWMDLSFLLNFLWSYLLFLIYSFFSNSNDICLSYSFFSR